MALKLRPANEADYPAIIALTNRAYRVPAGQAAWKVETEVGGQRIDAALLRDDLAAAPDAALLIASDGKDAHLGHVRLDPGPCGGWFLAMLTVDPDRQDAGRGRQLLEAAEAYAVDNGAVAIQMTVLKLRSELIAWYERRGYHRTGKTKPFPYGDERFGVPTRDDLKFEVLEKRLQAKA